MVGVAVKVALRDKDKVAAAVKKWQKLQPWPARLYAPPPRLKELSLRKGVFLADSVRPPWTGLSVGTHAQMLEHRRCTARMHVYMYMHVRVHTFMHTYLYIYVCMSVCMYGCMYVCIYACMYAYLYVGMYVCMYACMYVYMYVYMYVNMYVYMYVYMYVCMYASDNILVSV